MNILYFETLGSTNTYLKEHLELPHETAVVADIQTLGKGRLGRQWAQPPGNLAASLLVHDPKGDFSLYPLLCALAGADLVEAHTGLQPGIKWPNDLVLNGRKICGILCESSIGTRVSVVCGIGINLNLTAEELGEEQLPFATSLHLETGRHYDARALAAELMERLAGYLHRYAEEGFKPFLLSYEQKLVNCGKEVQVLYEGRTVQATCLGIAENGHLLCKDESGTFEVHSGEASVRGLYGYI